MGKPSPDQVEALIEAHLPLVEAVAWRRFPGLARDPDLLSWGRIGLWRAARTWDGVRPFPPYACVCIRRGMTRWLRTLSRWNRRPAAWDLPGQPGPEERVAADVDLDRRIRAACPPGSPEGYVLRRLAAGEDKEELARRLGCSIWRVTRLARKGWRWVSGGE